MVTSAQLRAARSLLNWTVRELSEKAGVHRNTITRAETDATAHGHAVAQVVRTLESAGVIFVEENGEGPGVRLRKTAPGTKAASIPIEDLNAENDE
ncbi:MAG: helix-turn-helix domain-containing protein [Roseiarcus sp.]